MFNILNLKYIEYNEFNLDEIQTSRCELEKQYEANVNSFFLHKTGLCKYSMLNTHKILSSPTCYCFKN